MGIGKVLLALLELAAEGLNWIVEFIDDHRKSLVARGFVALAFLGTIITSIGLICWLLITYKFVGLSSVLLTFLVAIGLYFGAKKIYRTGIQDNQKFGMRMAGGVLAFFIMLFSFSFIFTGMFSNQIYGNIFSQGANSRNYAFSAQAKIYGQNSAKLEATITAQSGTINAQATTEANAEATITAQQTQIDILLNSLKQAKQDAQDANNLIGCPTVQSSMLTRSTPIILIANPLTKLDRACIVLKDAKGVPYYWTTHPKALAVILPDLAGFTVIRASGNLYYDTQQNAIAKACTLVAQQVINLYNNQIPVCPHP